MFEYIKHKDIDFKLWDECIEASPNGIIYALSWYLDITAPGWDGIVAIEDGKYTAVMPIPVFKKFGIRYVKQPTHTQQLGIFSTKKEIYKEELEKINSLLRINFWYIESYEFNVGNKFELATEIKNVSISEYNTYHLCLNQPYQVIYTRYHNNRKRDIIKAKNNGIAISYSENVALLIDLFKENVASKIYGIKGFEYHMLQKIFIETKNRNYNFMLEAKTKEGLVVGMGLFLKYRNKIIYLFNASDPLAKKTGAMSLLIDYGIRLYVEKDLIFDFESPEVAKLANFYKKFGSESIKYHSLSMDRLPLAFRLIKNIRKNFYKTFMNSPSDKIHQ